MGGDGTGANHKVMTGPFAFDDGNWDITVHDPGDGGLPFLRRNFGGDGFAPTLPTATQLTNCLTELPYDENPWNDSGTLQSFRNRLEGWFGAGSIHNRVHVWVGGTDGTMLYATSPNDPVFWLHHCNIDRLWSEWQKLHPAELYHPAGVAGDTGPVGHNFPDSMQPWGGTTTVASMQDHHPLGYWYDTDEPDVTLTTPSLAFTDVPEGLGGGGVTTYRAIVFEVRSCETVTFEIVAGPTAGFGLTPLGTSVNVPSEHGQQPAMGRLWISYTSTNAGDVANGSVTVAQTGTVNQWVITLTANTIARPRTAAALALDRSGSMSGDAGGVTKHAKLLEAVEIFVDTMLEGDGLAIVSFDDIVARLMDVTDVGPQPPTPGSGRAQAAAILAGTDLDPRGLTAIGGAVVEAQDALSDAQASAPIPYDVQSVVVLTDGIENVAPMVNTIGGSITANTFAIGIGTANNISTAALNTLTQGTGGYLLVTGALTTDQEFRLSKYFLQILAGITSAEVVVDPVGHLVLGPTHRIPFTVAPGDYGCDVILTSPLSPFIDFRLQAPDGSIIDPGAASGIPAMSFVRRRYVSYYRTALPLGGPGKTIHAGKWIALLSLNPNVVAAMLRGSEKNPDLVRALRGRSVPYNLLVHAYSTLRVSAGLARGIVAPGERLEVSASVTEYGVPVSTRAAVWMDVRSPSGASTERDAHAGGGRGVPRIGRSARRGRVPNPLACPRHDAARDAVLAGAGHVRRGTRGGHATGSRCRVGTGRPGPAVVPAAPMPRERCKTRRDRARPRDGQEVPGGVLPAGAAHAGRAPCTEARSRRPCDAADDCQGGRGATAGHPRHDHGRSPDGRPDVRPEPPGSGGSAPAWGPRSAGRSCRKAVCPWPGALDPGGVRVRLEPAGPGGRARAGNEAFIRHAGKARNAGARQQTEEAVIEQDHDDTTQPEAREVPYRFDGEFYEACDCFSVCPCWTGDSPDEDTCTGVFAWAVESGVIDGVDVTGRRAVSVSHHAGPRDGAHQRVMIFVDDGATMEQTDALAGALSGSYGGPLKELAGLLGALLGVEQAPITFHREGRVTKLTVGRRIQVEGSATEGPEGRSMTLSDGKLSRVLGSPAEIGVSRRFRIGLPVQDMDMDLRGRSTMAGRFAYEHVPPATNPLPEDAPSS